MKCKECKLAEHQIAHFRRCKTGEYIGDIEYCICPLDNDDVFPLDYNCIDEEAYKKLLNTKGNLDHG